MIKSVSIQNWGPISNLQCQRLGRINLLVGKNGIGKTQAVKALYTAVNATEQYKRGIEHRSIAQLLTDKLYRTFMPKKIGELVKKGENELQFEMRDEKDSTLKFRFGKDTASQIQNVENTYEPCDTNSVFIPAKEVISLQSLILESRSAKFNMPGFDDTYLDLALALTPAYRGRNYKEFAEVRKVLKSAIGGKVEYDEERNEWYFSDDKHRVYGIALASEGIKKMSVVDVLLGNHFLTPESIVFIDEFEAALHPQLIARFAEMVVALSQKGIQFFITTHSYAAVKKFYILAHKNEIDIPFLSFEEDDIKIHNLREGLPDNPIVQESVKLYMEELDL